MALLSISHSAASIGLAVTSIVVLAASATLGAQPVPEQPACQDQELRITSSAAGQAGQMIDTAIAAIDKPTIADADRLTTWFGINRSDGAVAVRQTLLRARAFLPGASFRCSVSTGVKLGDVYAYVRPNRSFAIVLGSFFFRAADRGFDSKPGTIIHEMTHSVLAGATKDVAYGTAKARQLAKNDPAKAQSSADNFEYFVEATAFQLK